MVQRVHQDLDRRYRAGDGIAADVCLASADGNAQPLAQVGFEPVGSLPGPAADALLASLEVVDLVDNDHRDHKLDRAVDVERDVFELHLFPRQCWPALLLPRCKGFSLEAIFDF